MYAQGKVVSINVYVWNKYKRMSKDDDDADSDYDDDDDDDDEEEEEEGEEEEEEENMMIMIVMMMDLYTWNIWCTCVYILKNISAGNITANVTQVPLPKTAPGV